MNTSDSIKAMVKEKYSEIAIQSKETNQSSCCGSGACSTEVYNIMSDDYDQLKGYHSDADLGLGCGLPTAFAGIQPGQTVVDLGCGAGNDCFVARNETGDTGRVIGIDFTPAMINRAQANAKTLGFENVEFIQGDIEQMPLNDQVADVVVSNCVLNLVPNKQNVFNEIFRILKPGGHFSISDVVLEAPLPESIKNTAELYAGCVAGAILKDEYLSIIRSAGFTQIKIQQTKPIRIPLDILNQYLPKEEAELYHSEKTAIVSITVYAEKPQTCCCGSNGNCSSAK